MAYAGSFAKGFIDAFLAAQNQGMRRRHYQMMNDYYAYKMKLDGYDVASGKFINPATGKPEYDSQAQYFKAMQKMFPQKGMFGAPTGDGGDTQQEEPGKGEKGTYSLAQMTQMAEKAGFQGEDAAHMAALAQAESNGNPGAVGSAGEIGLTQINPHAWGDEMANSAKDPQEAFNAAYKVYKQQGWGAWSTDPSSPHFTPGNNGMRFFEAAKKAQAAATAMAAPTDTSTAKAPTPKTAKKAPPPAPTPVVKKPQVAPDDQAAIPSPTQPTSAAPEPEEDIAMGPPDPQWSTYNAPAILKQPPPSPPPQAQPAPAAVPSPSAPPPSDAGPDTSVPPPPDNNTMMSAKGGAIPYNSYRFTKYDDGGYVSSDTTPVVSSDASVQGDTQQTQQGAAQMGAAAGAMGSSATKGFEGAQDRKYESALRKSFTPNTSSTRSVPSLWNLPQNLKNSPAGKFFQNPGAAMQAIPGTVAQNFQTSPVGQMMSGASGYQRGGAVATRVTKFQDGGDAGGTGEGVTGSSTTGGTTTNTTNVGGVTAVTGDTTTGFSAADMGHTSNAGGSAGSEGGGSGTSGTSAAPGLAAAVNSMVNAIFGGPASAQTLSPSQKASLQSSLAQLAEARGTSVSEMLGPSGGNTGLSPSALAALRGAVNQNAISFGPPGVPSLGVPEGVGGQGAAPVGAVTTSALGPPGTGSSPGSPTGLSPSVVADINAQMQAYAHQKGYLSGMGTPGFPNPPSGTNALGFPAANPSIGPGGAPQGTVAPPGTLGPAHNSGVAGPGPSAPGGIAGPSAPGAPGLGPGGGGVAAGPSAPSGPNAPSQYASSMMGQGVAPPGMANQGFGGQGLAQGAEAVSQAPVTGGAFHGAPAPNVGRVAKGGPIRKYAAGGAVTFFADGGPADQQPVVQPAPIDYSGSQVTAEQLSGGSTASAADDTEDARDDAEMQRLDMEGPSEDGLPLGTPQISDSFGNPSQGASDGVVAGAQSLIADNSLGPQSAIPSQGESGQGTFYDKKNDMDGDHKNAVDQAVDPDGQLSPNMRHLASIESIYKYGVLTGHEKDGAAAAGAYLKNLVTEGQDYGDKALNALRDGNLNDAIGNLVAGYHQIPDGMHMNAKVNDDGTVHVQQVDLHNKVQWEGDVGKDELAKAAGQLRSGQAFWNVVGQSMAKYDPKDGAKVPLDTAQKIYDNADKQMLQIERGIQGRYFQGNNPIVNGRVAYEPQPPTPTGNARFDGMQRQQYLNQHREWQGYVEQNDKTAKNDTLAAKTDYIATHRALLRTALGQNKEAVEQQKLVQSQEADISKGITAKSKELAKTAELRQKADELENKPLSLSDTYKEDVTGKKSIVETANDYTYGKPGVPGIGATPGEPAVPAIVSSDAAEAKKNGNIFLPNKSDQDIIRDVIGDGYAHAKGNLPMDEVASAVKNLYQTPDPSKVHIDPLAKDGRPMVGTGTPAFYQITTPGSRPFRVSSDTFNAMKPTLQKVYKQRQADAEASKPAPEATPAAAIPSPAQSGPPRTGGALPLPSSMQPPAAPQRGTPAQPPGWLDWIGKHMFTEDQPPAPQ